MRVIHQLATAWLLVVAGGQLAAQDEDWRQWRGPQGTGSVTMAEDSPGPPQKWSGTENIAWKVEIEGRGHSTPVVAGQHVFLTTAVPVGDPLPPKASGRPGAHDNLPVSSRWQFVLICIDRASGDRLWSKVLREAVPVEGGHISASLASASPIVGNGRVYAMFGSQGLYCLDLHGALLWEQDFGQMHSKHGHGEGASPVLGHDTLVVNWDHEEQSFLVALRAQDGKQLWRRQRNEVTSWSSPLVVEVDGAWQAVVCGTERVRGYDLATGETLWECGGLSANIVASPVFDSASGILVVGSSYEIRKLMAIQLRGARGDLTDSPRVLWSRSRGTPYVPSLMLSGDGVYFLAHYQNILTRVRIQDGVEAPGAMRLGALGNIYASPVSDGRYVYVTDLRGTTQVITAGSAPEVVAINPLNEPVSASLAIAGEELFIRGEQHLFKIARSPNGPQGR